MQYDLSPACLLASIQHAVTDGPFVPSNFFPCLVGLTRLFSLSCSFFFLFLSDSRSLSILHSLFLTICLSISFCLLHGFLFHFNITSIMPYPFPCHLNVVCPSFCIAHFSVNILSALFLYCFVCFPVFLMFVYISHLPYFHCILLCLLYPSFASLFLLSLSLLLFFGISLVLLTELFQRCLEYF